MKTHKWNDIKYRGMSPARIKAIEEGVAEELVAMRLRALREDLGITQEEMAAKVDVAQAQISRVERREDHRVSTLRRYVEALGGKLEIAAVVKGKRVPLT